jgi:hypothetical protein
MGNDVTSSNLSVSTALQSHRTHSGLFRGHHRMRSVAEQSGAFRTEMARADKPSASKPSSAAAASVDPEDESTKAASAPATRSAISSSQTGEEKVFTPFGIFYRPTIAASAPVSDAPIDPWRDYFSSHVPGRYMYDADAMAQFERIYGAQAAAILRHFGTAPESSDPNFVSTDMQRAFYDAQGNRAFYTASDLILMMPEARAKITNIDNQDLIALFWSNPSYQFPTSSSSPASINESDGRS